jgi:hypothetical protein
MAVDHWLGQTEGVRFWGIGLTGTVLVMAFQPTVPFFLGNKLKSELSGWRKALVLVPLFMIGAAVTLFPDAIACSIHLRGYKCGA